MERMNGWMRTALRISWAAPLLGFLALSSAMAVGEDVAPGVTDTTIKVGYIGDMTGPIVSTSGPFRRGISTYLEYVNKEKGGVAGRSIQFIPEDDKYQVPLAIAAFRKLMDRDNVFAILGLSGSSQSTALDPEIRKLGVPVFGPQQAIPSEIENPFIFVTIASYRDIAFLAVEYALKQLAKKNQEPRIAAFTLRVQSGYEWAQDAEAALTKHGLKLAGHISIPPTAVEAAAQIKELQDLKANYVLLHGSPATSILFLKEAHRYGLKIPVVSMWGAFGVPVFKTVGEEAAGDFVGFWSFSHPSMAGKGLEELRPAVQKYGEAADLETFQVVHGWTTAKLFVEALKRAGKNLTRKSFISAVETIQNFDTEGLSAPVNFGPGNSYGIRACRLYGYDFKGQKVVALTDWMTP
jgi:branched-chain amino acid transport system substrate-binding protein